MAKRKSAGHATGFSQQDEIRARQDPDGDGRGSNIVMVINTNIAALTSANNLNQSTNMLNESLARLSSGSSIINASDNPAGLAESVSLTAQIGQTQAANDNVSNALSFSQTQDGYLQQIGSALDEMASLAVEAHARPNPLRSCPIIRGNIPPWPALSATRPRKLLTASASLVAIH